MKTAILNVKSFYLNIITNEYKNITIPNFISYFTLLFSLGGIYLLVNDHFLFGALLLWTACDIFDTLDGFVAKKFNMFSPLGADLDSLIDVFAFLVPPFLISLQSKNGLLITSAFIFVASGIFRLARFNVEKTAPGFVIGLQASLAAHLIYLVILLNISDYFLSYIYVILSILMTLPIISKGKYSLILTVVLMGLNFSILLVYFITGNFY